jgi:hypothetical protein
MRFCRVLSMDLNASDSLYSSASSDVRGSSQVVSSALSDMLRYDSRGMMQSVCQSGVESFAQRVWYAEAEQFLIME